MAPEKVFRKYSISSSFYFRTQSNFFSENTNLLRNALEVNSLYKNQPLRLNCKLCLTLLNTVEDFSSHGIPYFLR